jgi:hypothetical protein
LIVVGFGLGKRGGFGAVRLRKRLARFCLGFVAQRGMRPDVVVVIAPQRQLLAGIAEAVEYLFIRAFIRYPATHVYMRERGAGCR